MALYFVMIANTWFVCYFLYAVLCEKLFSFSQQKTLLLCVSVCVCGCVYVHHSVVLNVLGFDPKITQTLTEARTDQGSPKENEMEIKENVPYFFIHKGNI